MSLVLSPFLAALPLPHHLFFEYDEAGDVIMIDAATGERIEYGRARADSVSTLVASPVVSISDSPLLTPVAAVCPPAPARPPRAILNPEEEEDEGAASPVRNLAEVMAEAVLDGEPRDNVGFFGVAVGIPPPAGAPEDEGWGISVRCPDLALWLDMRHPRVLLNLLRFVESYNELAPPGEDIHLPEIPRDQADVVLGHDSVVNPAPEFAADVAELRHLLGRYSCSCSDCYPEEYGRYSSEDEDDYRRRYNY